MTNVKIVFLATWPSEVFPDDSSIVARQVQTIRRNLAMGETTAAFGECCY